MSGGSVPCFKRVQEEIPDVAVLLQPDNWRIPFFDYSIDNGAYAAYLGGRSWGDRDTEAYLKTLNKIPAARPPMWVLLPDVVGNWHQTVQLARMFLPLLLERDLVPAIALQDGCDWEQALEFKTPWLFLGGTTEWKLNTAAAACHIAHLHCRRLHVGRVNTAKRLYICGDADSVDGTTLNRYTEANLPIVKRALNAINGRRLQAHFNWDQ